MPKQRYKKKSYIITSAQASYMINKEGDKMPYGANTKAKAEPHRIFLNALEKLSDLKKAELIIVPIAGKNTLEDILHEELEQRKDIFRGESKSLNSNLEIRDIVTPPQNKDPTTGKKELVTTYNKSQLVPHTKQRFEPVAVYNSNKVKVPRYLYSTGAVTLPNYNTANSRGDMAERQHVFGALIVEILNDKEYLIRNIRALKNGKFVDLNNLYNGKEKIQKIRPSALILGDYHYGNHDEKALKATYEMIKELKPKSIVLHDFFDGYSVNRHEKDDFLLLVSKYEQGKLSLEDELREGYKELVRLSKLIGKDNKIYIIASNHHQFLTYYIKEKRWLNQDFFNHKICVELLYQFNQLPASLREKIDRTAYFLKTGYGLFGKIPNNVYFLGLNDNLKIGGYQLACHGHKGQNGRPTSSIKTKAIIGGGKSISGHTHKMQIYNNTYVVGTLSKLNLPYTHGDASAAIHANAAIYQIGSEALVQMLPIINGKWKIK